MYLTELVATVAAPAYDLKSFKRIKLAPGESAQLKFRVTPEMMKLVKDDGTGVNEPGDFKVWISGSCPMQVSVASGKRHSQ
jgi:beta-glucosidase